MKKLMETTIAPVFAYLTCHPFLYPINKTLYNLSLRSLGILNCNSASGEKFFISRTLPDYLELSAPVILDIGANVGNYSKHLSSQFPNANIHAFEPHPVNFEQLTKNALPNVTYHNIGIGARDENLILYDRADYNGSSHASLYQKVITDIHQQQSTQFTVPVKQLDNFAEENKISRIDFMKIDTEGHEFDVLEGASSLLDNNNIGIIQFEFGNLTCYSKHFIYEFKDKLPNHTLHRLLPRNLLKLNLPALETEIFGYQNIVALPNS